MQGGDPSECEWRSNRELRAQRSSLRASNLLQVAYDPDNVFARILRKEIPAKVVHEDERCLAFHDIAPQAPTHVLVLPKQPLISIDGAKPADAALLGHLLLVAAEIARKQNLAKEGYRIVINTGGNGGQSVFHLHVHILGGRALAWPPG